MNTAAGDSVGLGAIPGKSVDFLKTVKEAIKYANAVDCPMIHLMAGKIPVGQTKEACRAQFLDNLKIAADLLKDYGMVGTLEPINSKMLPGYFYSTPEEALNILEEVGAENLFYQCDLFHLETEKGNTIENVKNLYEKIAHFQIAQAPDRHEPSHDGTIDYDEFFKILEDKGFENYIGLEYAPKGTTQESLEWAKKYLRNTN
ncbi:unnamed protein product [Oikopleura dioica]|uniref:Xylose isomerase-like TIM barrel domain-containing protein n=1 Tax=Oikopleura dioica TaxID=34765 RepID=E4X1V9_OIKDI|nr:unnamed protein product [Oikopleura dioica]CBY35944.1 unnamed protein product [Oikopleura dioica]